jgi:hypothetical protein
MLQIVASLTIVIYNYNVITIQATESPNSLNENVVTLKKLKIENKLQIVHH